ncbi:glucosamine 6-phosphate synthetase (plasmid) [Mycobacterium paragordonae]|nr:glucosamine 6-phosphate synthetase [Mycobacterium paragordonae]
MCILSFLPAGVGADVESLFNGGISNPHGHGWAIVTGERVLVGKSLDLTEALDGFAVARDEHLEGPALFHSRWATHGGLGVSNVHPFSVGGGRRTVVAHNGILPRIAHPEPGDERSDTRKFADEILPTRFRRLDRPAAFKALSAWCGSGNKLVILTVDPRYSSNAYVVNEEAGQWDPTTGIWHSNGDYRAAYWAGYGGVDISGVDVCEMCGYGTAGATGYCDVCGSCQDCLEPARECLCYLRARCESAV